MLLVVSDEEVGSRTSRALTEAEAKRSDCVLVSGTGDGSHRQVEDFAQRRGDGTAFAVTGKAVHAGVDFAAGASAIVEAARQVQRIASFTDLRRGTTVNPGLISGGTRTNVVAAEARIGVDMRVVRMRDAEPLDRKFHSLRPVDNRCGD